MTEWLHTHIDNLTGVQPATPARYRTNVTQDIDPMFGSMRVSAVTENTIARVGETARRERPDDLQQARFPVGGV